MKPMINNIINGFNATIFAYGMTGAGKTYTMLGDIHKRNHHYNQDGIVMLAVENLFIAMEK